MLTLRLLCCRVADRKADQIETAALTQTETETEIEIETETQAQTYS